MKKKKKSNTNNLTRSHKFYAKEVVQFSSVAQSCPTLCDPMDCSTPGFLVHHQLLLVLYKLIIFLNQKEDGTNYKSNLFPTEVPFST